MKGRQAVRWAIQRTEQLLERNRDPIDTFEGVLNRSDVRALNTLVRVANASLRPRRCTTSSQ